VYHLGDEDVVSSPPREEVIPLISKEVYMELNAMRRNGKSIRAIARETGLHRNTVRKHLAGGEFPRYHKGPRRESILAPYLEAIEDYLEEDDYRATRIFENLKNRGYTGGYDRVKRQVRAIKARRSRLAYARFETEPGRQAQFDWGDFQVEEPSGRTTTVYAFLLVLGFSRADYVEYAERTTLETFMDGHIRAFRYLGGVPAEILYDNMKFVVVGRDEAGRPIFNPEFLHFAHHYGFQPRLCPAYGPWTKGKVERPIDYLRESFWRGYRFSSLGKTNEEVRAWLDGTANCRVHGTHHQPVDERWRQERPHLGPLPVSDYDTSLKVFRKVYRDCQVSFNANRYVVPHRAVGRKVMLKVKNSVIRIYHDQDLLATYEEPRTKNNVVENPRFYEELRRDREQLRRKYGRAKGRATRGLSRGSLWIDVHHRPLSEYERLAGGGEAWKS
jgi:transposase